jgi:hypothetical protein
MVGFFSLPAAADAQALSTSTAGAAFDGTYQFISSTKLAETYISPGTSRMAQCPDRIAGPLTIVNGQPRFSISIPGKPADFAKGAEKAKRDAARCSRRHIRSPAG